MQQTKKNIVFNDVVSFAEHEKHHWHGMVEPSVLLWGRDTRNRIVLLKRNWENSEGLGNCLYGLARLVKSLHGIAKID